MSGNIEADFGLWIMDFEFWMVDWRSSYALRDSGGTREGKFWMVDFGLWIVNFGWWILDFGFRVQH